MSDIINGRPTTNFWIIGGAALVWNLIGLLFYYSQVTMTPDVAATLPQAQQEFFAAMPVWATSAHAVAVTFGVVGSLLLLFRKAWAVPAFGISLLGIVAQDVNAFVLSDGLAVFGTNAVFLPALVLVVAVALILYARSTKRRGWLS